MYLGGSSNSSYGPDGGVTGDVADVDVPICLCGKESVRFTVRKEGPNQNREFFTCSKT